MVQPQALGKPYKLPYVFAREAPAHELKREAHPLTAEERSDRARRAWETRRARAGDISTKPPAPSEARGRTSDAPPDPTDIVGRLLDATARRDSSVYIAHDPYETSLMLPDGTRIGSHRNYEREAVEAGITFGRNHVLLVKEAIGEDLNQVLKAGVVRYSPQEGVEVRKPLTERQAQVIADDWNFVYRGQTLRLDIASEDGHDTGVVSQKFEPPVTADRLRRWSQDTWNNVNAKKYRNPYRERLLTHLAVLTTQHLTARDEAEAHKKAWDTRGRGKKKTAPAPRGEPAFYHGTSANRMRSILKHGISGAHAQSILPGEAGHVYLAKNQKDAQQFAEWSAQNLAEDTKADTADAAIFEVHIPAEEHQDKLHQDEHYPPAKKLFKFKGTIKPAWIKGVCTATIHVGVFAAKTNPPVWKCRKLSLAAGPAALYAVVILEMQPVASENHPKALAAVPHPLTPDERSAIARKAWVTRGQEKESPVLATLRAHGTTHLPAETKFILPDGTRIKGSYGEHHYAIGFPHRLEAVLAAGVIRYQAGTGVHVTAPITETQAQVIADDWNTEYQGKPLYIDTGRTNRPAFEILDAQQFDPPINADAVRRWINRHADATHPQHFRFHLADPHPLTPEERSSASKKAWQSREHGKATTTPDEPSLPDDYYNYVARYHGTSSSAAAAIRQHGLIPAASRGGDTWGAEHGMTLGGQTASVFFTDDQFVATTFARVAAAANPGSKPVVVEIGIPPEEYHRTVAPDEQSHFFGAKAEKRVGVIPKEWVKRIGEVTCPRRTPADPLARPVGCYITWNLRNDRPPTAVQTIYGVLLVDDTTNPVLHNVYRDRLLLSLDAYVPHPLTPEERTAVAKKAWDTRGRTADVPPEPGTTPIPDGMVRGYHYTDNLESVLTHGLDVTFAKGSTYGEPNAIWMSTKKPGDFKNYVEVFVTPAEIGLNGPDLYPKNSDGTVKTASQLQEEIAHFNAGDHDFFLRTQTIPPDRFVTYHEPWHDHFRYMEKDPAVRARVIAGEFDWMLDNPEYGPALLKIKRDAPLHNSYRIRLQRLLSLDAYVPHPLTPDERTAAAIKAWISRQKGIGPPSQPAAEKQPPMRCCTADALSHLTEVLRTQGVDAVLAIAPAGMKDNMDRIMAHAGGANAELRDTLDSVMQQYGGRATATFQEAISGTGTTWIMGPVKEPTRILEKAFNDYDGDVTRVQDVVRATVAVDNKADLDGVIAALTKNFDLTRPVKNSFGSPKQGCYRDALLNVRLKGGTVGEIQVHYKPLLRAKELQGGHDLYIKIRDLATKPQTPNVVAAMAGLVAASCQLYNASYGA